MASRTLKDLVRDIFAPFSTYQLGDATLNDLEEIIRRFPSYSAKYRSAAAEIERRHELMKLESGPVSRKQSKFDDIEQDVEKLKTDLIAANELIAKLRNEQEKQRNRVAELERIVELLQRRINPTVTQGNRELVSMQFGRPESEFVRLAVRDNTYKALSDQLSAMQLGQVSAMHFFASDISISKSSMTERLTDEQKAEIERIRASFDEEISRSIAGKYGQLANFNWRLGEPTKSSHSAEDQKDHMERQD